ncbi:MAG TPA: aminotransferase class V-fold PLP-dependent enzyme [Methylophilaceae bacterium]
MTADKDIIRRMFDPEDFRRTGHTLIDLLADELRLAMAGERPVLNWQQPETADLTWQAPLPTRPTLDSTGLTNRLRKEVLPGMLAVHHPHNMGHQVASPLPIAALCDLVAALSNQAMAVYETGPSATMLERQVIRWLDILIGWPAQGDNGILTSGGAQANLTALLAARQHARDCWRRGMPARPSLRILASEHCHYSIARAAGIMGLGTDAVIRIRTDTAGRMLPADIARAHAECTGRRETVMAVVANAGSTATGSVDPLQEIGVYCRRNNIWLHVDGAHGASALLSKRYRGLLRGLELADSIVWDGHKLLYMPATVSAVLFRSASDSYLAFAQQASYLFHGGTPETEGYNVSYRTLECTKRMMALKLWTAFSLYGTQGLAALIDEAFDKARLFADMLQARTDFELLMPPHTNIVCFRHLAAGLSDGALERHQMDVRKRLVESGQFHLTQVELHGRLWLRTTLMNPFTQQSHLQTLIDHVSSHSA